MVGGETACSRLEAQVEKIMDGKDGKQCLLAWLIGGLDSESARTFSSEDSCLSCVKLGQSTIPNIHNLSKAIDWSAVKEIHSMSVIHPSLTLHCDIV